MNSLTFVIVLPFVKVMLGCLDVPQIFVFIKYIFYFLNFLNPIPATLRINMTSLNLQQLNLTLLINVIHYFEMFGTTNTVTVDYISDLIKAYLACYFVVSISFHLESS